jgi:hypothetical protein
VVSDHPVEVEFDVKMPIPSNGWVALRIKIADLGAVSEADKTFLIDAIERLGRLAGRDVVPPAVPAVLRGVSGRA